jgi:hypothetical protein
MPHAPAPPLARTSAALSAVAVVRPGTGLVALILALLLRLFARKEVAWSLLEDEAPYDHEAVYNPRAHAETDFDGYAFCGVDPHALYLRPMGRAPHAACIEAGLVADWILPFMPNRGMRAGPRTRPMPRRTRPARAPPREHPCPRRNTPPTGGAHSRP